MIRPAIIVGYITDEPGRLGRLNNYLMTGIPWSIARRGACYLRYTYRCDLSAPQYPVQVDIGRELGRPRDCSNSLMAFCHMRRIGLGSLELPFRSGNYGLDQVALAAQRQNNNRLAYFLEMGSTGRIALS